MLFELFLTLLICVLSYTEASFDYCQISAAHTMCRYQGISPQCGTILKRGLPNMQKAKLLNHHNQMRAMVANGHELRGSPGPQPSAADMNLLKWDDELAVIAQNWADQCTNVSDESRSTVTFPEVGQSIYTGDGLHFCPCRAVMASSAEAALVDGRKVGTDEYNSLASSHYSQIVSSKLQTVGCGYISFQPGGGVVKNVLVCNYGSDGSRKVLSPYTPGHPCSACPGGTQCSGTFAGLCATLNDDSQEPVAPSTHEHRFWSQRFQNHQGMKSSSHSHHHQHKQERQDAKENTKPLPREGNLLFVNMLSVPQNFPSPFVFGDFNETLDTTPLNEDTNNTLLTNSTDVIVEETLIGNDLDSLVTMNSSELANETDSLDPIDNSSFDMSFSEDVSSVEDEITEVLSEEHMPMDKGGPEYPQVLDYNEKKQASEKSTEHQHPFQFFRFD